MCHSTLSAITISFPGVCNNSHISHLWICNWVGSRDCSTGRVQGCIACNPFQGPSKQGLGTWALIFSWRGQEHKRPNQATCVFYASSQCYCSLPFTSGPASLGQRHTHLPYSERMSIEWKKKSGLMWFQKITQHCLNQSDVPYTSFAPVCPCCGPQTSQNNP